jgi:hypothetical protein
MKEVMRFVQMSPIKTILLVLLLLSTVRPENKVFSDPAFPYRVVCNPEWVEDGKNDSVLYLKNTEAGKKTRLQLQKYTVDSWYDSNNNGWSRFRFDINYSFILGVGTIGSIDSTQNKKLGGARAFEIFAYYWEKSDNGTVWWAEYVRWTDFNGIGYMASIIGDTLDMKTNVKNKTYIALLDSITLAQFSTGNAHKNMTAIKEKQPQYTNEPVRFDLLGRNVMDYYGRQGVTISARNNTLQCIIKPKHAP